MSKNDLFIDIIKNLNRRKKEILDISSIAEDVNNINYYYFSGGKRRVNPNYQLKSKNEIIIKSTILIFYSHREGLIKFCGKKYIEFLNNKGLKRKDIDKIFVEHFIGQNKGDLSNLFEVLLDDKKIPIDDNIVKNIGNLDFSGLESFFKNIGLNFDSFVKNFEENVIKLTGLEKGDGFLERFSNFKKGNHFFLDYIEINRNGINGKKTLEKILKVKKGEPNDIGLVCLRHRIAHGAENINISYRIFKNLSKIIELLIDVFIEAFKQQINNKFD